MSLSLEIVPLFNSLDLYGEPNASSAYSLSGYVSVSLRPSFFLLDNRRTTSILLQSLELSFEGQSEVIASNIGYSAFRLCSLTRELASPEGIELSNDGHEDSSAPCRWEFVFDIPVPSWLPASASFGLDEIGNMYTLYATAKYTNLDDNRGGNSWLGALCSPFRSRQHTANAEKSITVRRYADIPSETPQPEIPSTTYHITSKAASPSVDSTHIPPGLLNKLLILASVPEYVDLDDQLISITLRLRTKDLSVEECKKLRLNEFSVDIVQRDKCRSSPSREYTTRFPVPGESAQPPSLPLRTEHRLGALLDIPTAIPGKDITNSRSFSLLPPGESGVFKLAGDTDVFANDANNVEMPTWYTLQTKIPFVHCAHAKNTYDPDWAGRPVIRPSAESALFSVRHELRISMIFAYDFGDDRGSATEALNFAVPLRYAHAAPVLLSQPPRISAEVNEIAGHAETPMLPQSMPYAPSLPPYSQLYHSNGDRKLDPTPLPLYTPNDCGPSSPSTDPDNGKDSPNDDEDEDASETSRLL